MQCHFCGSTKFLHHYAYSYAHHYNICVFCLRNDDLEEKRANAWNQIYDYMDGQDNLLPRHFLPFTDDEDAYGYSAETDLFYEEESYSEYRDEMHLQNQELEATIENDQHVHDQCMQQFRQREKRAERRFNKCQKDTEDWNWIKFRRKMRNHHGFFVIENPAAYKYPAFNQKHICLHCGDHGQCDCTDKKCSWCGKREDECTCLDGFRCPYCGYLCDGSCDAAKVMMELERYDPIPCDTPSPAIIVGATSATEPATSTMTTRKAATTAARTCATATS